MSLVMKKTWVVIICSSIFMELIYIFLISLSSKETIAYHHIRMYLPVFMLLICRFIIYKMYERESKRDCIKGKDIMLSVGLVILTSLCNSYFLKFPDMKIYPLYLCVLCMCFGLYDVVLLKAKKYALGRLLIMFYTINIILICISYWTEK